MKRIGYLNTTKFYWLFLDFSPFQVQLTCESPSSLASRTSMIRTPSYSYCKRKCSTALSRPLGVAQRSTSSRQAIAAACSGAPLCNRPAFVYDRAVRQQVSLRRVKQALRFSDSFIREYFSLLRMFIVLREPSHKDMQIAKGRQEEFA